MQITGVLDFTHWGQIGRRDFDIKFTKREWGGYEVWNRANGRHLGWVVKGSDNLWHAYTGDAPYRPTEDDILADVDPWLSLRNSDYTYRPVGIDSTREWAVREILNRLVGNNAPAIRDTEEAPR